jgi:pantetheine-phosphate adenylyltransferase
MIVLPEIKIVLEKHEVDMKWSDISKKWSEPHRYYHNLNHLMDILRQIDLKYPKIGKERDILILSAVFHDIIYNPSRSDNEKKSADFFIRSCKKENNITELVYDIILSTEKHESSTKLGKEFNEMDMDVLNRSVEDLLNWEILIRMEYEIYPNKLYKEGRLNFLNTIIRKFKNNEDNIYTLIDHVNRTYK